MVWRVTSTADLVAYAMTCHHNDLGTATLIMQTLAVVGGLIQSGELRGTRSGLLALPTIG